MTEQATPSERPWVYHPDTRHITREGDERIVVDIVNVFWGEDETNANGEHLVRCVNSFDALVAALESVQRYIRARMTHTLERDEALEMINKALTLAGHDPNMTIFGPLEESNA